MNIKQKDKILLCAKNLTKNFSCSDCGIYNISLALLSNSIVGMLGESGSGKTTLLRILANIDNKHKGNVQYCLKNSTISYIPQVPILFPHMNVYENIRIAVPKKKHEEILEELYQWRIDHKVNQYPQDLSGGEQQMVCLARAFIKKPNIVLLDEPFSQIDYAKKTVLKSTLFEKIHNSNKPTSCIVVSHDYHDILDICDRILIIHKGIIVENSTEETIRKRPKSLHTIRIMGSFNEMTGYYDEKLNIVTPLLTFSCSFIKKKILTTGSTFIIVFQNDKVSFTNIKEKKQKPIHIVKVQDVHLNLKKVIFKTYDKKSYFYSAIIHEKNWNSINHDSNIYVSIKDKDILIFTNDD